MKTLGPLLLIFFLFFQTNSSIHAQLSKEFDSILIRKSIKNDLTYRINDEYLKKVSLSKSHPKLAEMKGKHVLGDFGSGLLTLVSGVGVGNTKENVDLKFTSKLKCQDDKYNWTINLFVNGLMEKHRSRQSTESGGFSMDVDRYASVNWDIGARGEILNNNSKIGDFILIKRPKFKKLANNNPLEFLSDSLGEEDPIKEEEEEEEESDIERTYAIYGQVHNQNFSIVASVKNKRFWLFQDKKLKAVLQLPRTVNFVEDKTTYALLDPDMTSLEMTYWLKLGLYNAYLASIVDRTEYNW